jgi:zinc transport system permease protein
MEPTAPTWAEFVSAFPIFREAILCGIIAGAVLGMLGVQVVLRRTIFVSAVLSQVAGLGVAAAIFAGMIFDIELEPMIGAVSLCLAATGILALRPERVRLSREAMLAAVWVFAGGAALIIGSRITAEAHDIEAILFGSAVLVRPIDLTLVAVVGVGCVVAQVFLGRGWLFSGFDHDVARVHGLPAKMLDVALWLCVAGMVSVGTRALGALPVFAMTALPGMAALMLVPGMRGVVPVATLLGALAGGLGYLAAYFESWPVGASQTVVAAIFVALSVPVRLLRAA